VLTLILVLTLVAPTVTGAQDAEDTGNTVFWIGLANGSERESIMAKALRDLIRTHDVGPWILTRKILIDERQIPHSHPVLTIHTRHIGAQRELLSTFIHEQLHWLEEKPWLDDFQAAMTEFERLFPVVPSSADGGARDKQSTYRHLLVCDMELQALSTLIGRTAARDTLAQATHYEWIYDKVLSDPRVREVALSHGFNVSQGVPNR
jgi:hypothetical protein